MTAPIPELTLTGSPRDRGRAHGEELRDLIASALDAWLDHLAGQIQGLNTDPEPFLTEMVSTTGFLGATSVAAPDLVDEVAGLAEGADQPVATMFAWQLIDEVWWYVDERRAGDRAEDPGCSTFAVNDGISGLAGQTQDLYRHIDGHQVMLRYHDPDGLTVLAPSVAGLLALNGVNSAGLGVGVTTVSELAHSDQGVPSGFLVPMLARCPSVDLALEQLGVTPIASGNSFTLATAQRSVVVEASAQEVTVVDDGDRALHTNHALAQAGVADYVRFASSVDRLDQLQAGIRPGMGVDEVAALLGTGAVCRSRDTGDDVLTVGTMIFELGPTPVCHYAPGPLDTDTLVAYPLDPT